MNSIIKFLPTVDAPESTRLPQRSTKFSAGYDFYAPTDIFIPAGGESVLVPLNVKAIMPGDMVLMLFIRSSLAVKLQMAQTKRRSISHVCGLRSAAEKRKDV
ncbi:hypothetical protein [Phascolarctobacterium succinatutens]|uniref:hypothetical protein n=1 Tax=Phascolarctobacterium succinatutens TaxID=626940 RepID=UPI0040283634